MQVSKQIRSRINSENIFPYLIYYPDDYPLANERLPLIVFLHGGGERGIDPHLLTCHSLPSLCERGLSERCLVFSPQCPEKGDWYLYIADLMDCIDQISDIYDPDDSKISLTGISMGAYGVWELAITYPSRFSALAPICGGGMAWRSNMLKNIPVWAFHGQIDEIVDVRCSVEMVNAVNQAGGNAKLTVYESIGHDSWNSAYNDPNLIKWLIQQSRKTGERS
ncbi:MAG: alpha/beta hydrolase-fold protein [Flexilinea sp.]